MVTLQTKETVTYKLIALSGQEISKGTLTETDNNINTSTLAKGTYLIEVKNDKGEMKVVKIVKE